MRIVAWLDELRWASNRSRYESMPVFNGWDFERRSKDGSVDEEVREQRNYWRHMMGIATFFGSALVTAMAFDPSESMTGVSLAATCLVAILFVMSFSGTTWYEKGWRLFSAPWHISWEWALWAASLLPYIFFAWALSLPVGLAIFLFLLS